MSHVRITAKDHVRAALVIRTSTGLQNVVPGSPLDLPLIDLETAGKQCRETDYNVQVVDGDAESKSKSNRAKVSKAKAPAKK